MVWCKSDVCANLTLCYSSFGPVLTGAAVLFGQQVVGERRCVRETLHGRVQEARVAQVVEARSHPVHSLPLHGEFVPWKEQFLRCWDAITLTTTEAFRACGNTLEQVLQSVCCNVEAKQNAKNKLLYTDIHTRHV